LLTPEQNRELEEQLKSKRHAEIRFLADAVVFTVGLTFIFIMSGLIYGMIGYGMITISLLFAGLELITMHTATKRINELENTAENDPAIFISEEDHQRFIDGLHVFLQDVVDSQKPPPESDTR
jgi:hypothetical protein